jgi:hypothetical protein
VVDSHVQNEGNGWAGSGANPWHLDEDTESILFLTNESDQPARIAAKVAANGVTYYLTSLQLNPHETRAIDMRKLRDAQVPDFKNNKIPAAATDGSVTWVRADNLPVMGRLMVIHRQQGIASNYDCCICPCPMIYQPSWDYVNPANSNLLVQGTAGLIFYAGYLDCNDIPWYYNENGRASWSSQYPNIATVNSPGRVTGQSGGTTSVTAQYSDYSYYYNPYDPPYCFGTLYYGSASAQVKVDNATMSSPVQTIDGSTTPNFYVTTTGPDTPTSYAWSFTAPSGAGDNPNVSFNPNNQASTTTNAHWFALPNDTCNASTSAAYTIIATVTFPGGAKSRPQTTLTVSLLATAGYENEAFVSGLPSTGQNSQGIWVVTGQGSLWRVVYNPVVVYATTSQFYNKTYAHENKHYQQWTTGMNSDLYLVSNLMNQLSPLTGTTKTDLQNKISNTISTWSNNQHSTYASRLSAAEAEAYQVSDPIAPEYYYQSTCGARGM